jgi:hypothetical protein
MISKIKVKLNWNKINTRPANNNENLISEILKNLLLVESVNGNSDSSSSNDRN